MSLTKQLPTLTAILFLLSSQTAAAAPSYIQLADSPTIVVDWTKGTTQTVTLGGNREVTFLNGQRGGKYLLIIKQDANGSRLVTWPSSVHWPGTYGPTLTTIAGKADYFFFVYNGSSYDMVGISQGL